MATYNDTFITTFRAVGTSSVAGAFQAVGKGATDATGKLAAMGSTAVAALGSIASVAAIAATAIAAVAVVVGKVAWEAIKAAAKFETLEKRLKGAFRDSKTDVVAFAKELNKMTPFELPQVADLMIQMKVRGMDPLKNLPTILDTSAAFGSVEAGEGIALALGQMMNRGKVQQEELNQLMERGVDVNTILAESFGVTKEQLAKMVDQGLRAEPVVNALLNSMDKEHGGKAAEGMNTFEGSVSNLKESWNELLVAFGSPVLPYLTEKMQELTELLGTKLGTVGTTGTIVFASLITVAERAGAAFMLVVDTVMMVTNLLHSAYMDEFRSIEIMITRISALMELYMRIGQVVPGISPKGGPLADPEYWKGQKEIHQIVADSWARDGGKYVKDFFSNVENVKTHLRVLGDETIEEQVNRITREMAGARERLAAKAEVQRQAASQRPQRPVDLKHLMADDDDDDPDKKKKGSSSLQDTLEHIFGGGRRAAQGVKATEVGRWRGKGAGTPTVKVDVTAGGSDVGKAMGDITKKGIEEYSRWLFGTPQGRAFAKQALAS